MAKKAKKAKKRSRTGALAGYLRRTSLHRGLLGDDRFWRVVFFAMFGGRVLRRVMGSVPEVVAVEKLKPGQLMQVEAIDPRQLKGRRTR